jgi:hypothetical protein
MNRSALLLSLSAGLLLAAGPASAGTCSAEIEALQKTIASMGALAGSAADAGTAGAAVSATGNIPVPAARNGNTTGAPDQVPAPNGTGATGGMMAQGGAGGAPAETAPQDSTVPQSGPPAIAAWGTPDPDAASQSLSRAQLFDQVGDEDACMREVNQAKSQLGQQ